MKQAVSLTGLAALAALIAAGCGGHKNPLLLPNQPPEVELFTRRVDNSSAGPFAYRFQWEGHDPDGRIDHFVYSFGSPADDLRSAAWTATSAREQALSFQPRKSSGDDDDECGKIEPRVFTVRAVDAAGTMSDPASAALFDGAIAPRVEIVSPHPNPLVRLYADPTFCIEWVGTAPDDKGGMSSEGVAKYKFKLLTETTEVSLYTARANPDSVRRYYAPRGWAGWDSTRGRATRTLLRDLKLDREYVFVITCFDECGNYDPLFSFSKNMLYLRVTAALPLPRITLFNEFVLYEHEYGSFDPTRVVHLEVPAGQPITFNWYASPSADRFGHLYGAPIRGYRWALDLADLAGDDDDDDRPTADSARRGRPGRWSRWSITNTSATIGPFNGNEVHKLYIEARDKSGCEDDPGAVSLAVLQLTTVAASFNQELLIVDDTRLVLDRVYLGTACGARENRPVGAWPTAAELDTFLYARGGAPWKCYPPVNGQPQLSTPGIFFGYPFDTLGTNMRTQDLTIRLSKLGQYRHVIWLVDAAGALNNRPGTDAGDLSGPQTSMRYMNSNQKTNTLAAYVRQGGLVWLAGGGAGTAAMVNFNRSLNDNTQPAPATLTFRNADHELVPGRFMYDQVHWRSEFKQYRVNSGRIRRYLGRFDPGTGGSPGIYANLPAEIQLKTPATDPFPPNRSPQTMIVFYQTQFDIEFLSAANEIVEDQDPRPRREDRRSTLDTLYSVTASTLQPDTGPGALQSVVMTYYHGDDNAPLLHTGFSIWSFRRAQCVQLVDFVLQQLWGLARQQPVPAAIAPEGAVRPVGRQTQPRERAEPAAARVARHD